MKDLGRAYLVGVIVGIIVTLVVLYWTGVL